MQKLLEQVRNTNAKFDKTDFMFVLHPCMTIWKYFGFVPLKLTNSQNLRQRNNSIQWDPCAVATTLLALCVWIVGFSYGLNKISLINTWQQVRNMSGIAYFSIWLNIGTTFTLGLVAWIASWYKIADLMNLCAIVFEIDEKFKRYFNIKFNYYKIRTWIYLAFGIMFCVPAVFSMVNCVIVMPTSLFSITSPCYWFVCFVPIFLFTAKEFQFVLLLRLFKTKLATINGILLNYIEHTRNSTSGAEYLIEVPNPKSSDTQLNIDNIQKILEIYSVSADGVELVMKAFASHLLLSTTAAICIITIQAYYLFAQLIQAMSMEAYHIVFIVVWLILQILLVTINIGACNATANTMASTSILLHKLRTQLKLESDSVFYQIVQMFSLEVLQRKNQLSADGFFDINNRLITSIFSTVTTYLIILIQFHLGNSKDVV